MALELIRGLYNIKPGHRGGVLTIGNFDGVHLGHQVILRYVKELAGRLRAPSLVMTFEPLPKEFFGKNPLIPRLTRLREKYHAFAACQMDYLFLMRFTKQLAELSPDDFIAKILLQGLGVKHVVVGDDFRFGYKREGDFALLQQAGKKYGFSVENMQSYLVENQRVSSTLVREALANADHAAVQKLLGHPFSLYGRVVHGDKRGRIIGFPTANIYLHRKVTPVSGVYSVRMHGVEPTPLPGVANVGIRPTIGGTRSILEVHLFDFAQEIYGQQVQVEFCKKIRDEKRFDNLEQLKEQIWKDAEAAREYFKK